jgi:hypothetical protein
MKSQYRQAVESVIAQEAKLAEVTQAHAESALKERHLADAVRANRETLERYESRVSEIERNLVT